ncbi:hypothetical protein H5410_020696 [Solanum commersonii]|uniref:Uncharacterized protein n=1 Tax=Solanum commersonii TaxID=4109 RepID=A0A9J5ZBV3_SOLCO|nr:hypothetical protein H5410_020696 [Solanum commersonii]
MFTSSYERSSIGKVILANHLSGTYVGGDSKYLVKLAEMQSKWFLYILTPTKKVALSSDLTGTLVFGC